ncbi:HNH endonuclease [Leucobacter japonicus]|uniref:HNH endonuclease n=1 Tax=Leucobacter japonicus TaxID=1461259 RepID=UPI00094959E2
MRGLDDRTYRKRTAALKAQRHDCWLCLKPIDYTLPWKHKDAFTADHVQPRANGGHLYGEIRAAHRSCNSSRSNRVTTVTQAPTTALKW